MRPFGRVLFFWGGWSIFVTPNQEVIQNQTIQILHLEGELV